MIVDIVQNRSSVEVSHINKNGQIDIISIPATFSNWVKCDDTDDDKSKDYINWTGESVKKIGGYKFMDLNLREFLVKTIDKETSDKIFAYNKPNWYAVDIEIDVRKAQGFPQPDEAKYPISSIQITNNELSTVIMMVDDMNRVEGTEEYRQFIEDRVNAHFKDSDIPQKLIQKHSKDGKLLYNHIIFKTETEMMNKFFEYQRKVFHCVMGWNWKGFDAPYISNRCKLIGVNQSKASPVNQIDEKTFTPKHRLEMDYMDVVDKYERGVEKTSLSLDFIGCEALGISKVHYDGSFLDLFLDRDNFITYSAIDTVVLMMIHLKLNTISSLEMISYYAKIPLVRGFSTIAIGDALFWDEQFSNGIVFCHDDLYADKDEDDDTNFEGGYVIDPRYKTAEWVILKDFKSLYPTCGQSLGCSFDNIIKENATIAEQKEYAKEGHRISLNGTVYDKNNTGVLKSIWDKLIYERYHFKDIMIDITNVLLPIVDEYINKLNK